MLTVRIAYEEVHGLNCSKRVLRDLGKDSREFHVDQISMYFDQIRLVWSSRTFAGLVFV